MPDSAQILFASFDLNIGKYSIPIVYWQAGAIIFLIFLLILSLAQFRHHTVEWSLKGGVTGVFFGFLMALFLEGFLIIGGRTALTGLLGWKNPPLPVARALDAGRAKLVQVLGVQSEIPSAYAYKSPSEGGNEFVENAETLEADSVEATLKTIQSLNPQDQKSLKNILCSP